MFEDGGAKNILFFERFILRLGENMLPQIFSTCVTSSALLDSHVEYIEITLFFFQATLLFSWQRRHAMQSYLSSRSFQLFSQIFLRQAKLLSLGSTGIHLCRPQLVNCFSKLKFRVFLWLCIQYLSDFFLWSLKRRPTAKSYVGLRLFYGLSHMNTHYSIDNFKISYYEQCSSTRIMPARRCD